jgi:hypothetical protein
MRTAILLSLGLTLLVATATPAGDERDTQPSKDSYVKVRVEVEVRGILRVTDMGATVTARDRMYDRFNDAEEITDEGRATVYTLDFTRAKDQRELATVLNGKEVVVTGMSELRMVNQKVRPGGFTGGGPIPQFPSPTWSLQRAVLVTGLKSAGDN